MGIPDDSTVIFNYLPVELWMRVTETLTDPRDLTNLKLASQVFRNLLSPRRVEFLFPEVWKTLGMKWEIRRAEAISNDKMSYDSDDSDAEFTVPLSEGNKCLSDILSHRLVCKSWCEGVDLFYENLPGPGHYAIERDGKVPWDEKNAEYRKYFSRGNKVGNWIPHHFGEDEPPQDMVRWMNFFQASHLDTGNSRNPMIGRFISIIRRVENTEAGEVISHFLGFLNPHIHHSQMTFLDSYSRRLPLYKEMRNVLTLLSNLKTLKIMYDSPRLTPRPSIKDEYESLQSEITRCQLPTLPHLVFLSVKYFPSRISNALISANNHITGLEIIKNCKWDYIDPGYNIYTTPLPNLKQLSVTCYETWDDFENLNKPEVNWSLEKIHLVISQGYSYRPWSRVFSLLESKWAATLTNLATSLPRARNWEQTVEICEESLSFRLNLPNVQRLQLTAGSCWSLDFILPMRDTLEVLEVKVITNSMFHPELCKRNRQLQLLAKRQIIQFGGYFCQFQKSNIWKLFPRLQRIHFGEGGEGEHAGSTIYTRRQWEERDKREEDEILPCCSFGY